MLAEILEGEIELVAYLVPNDAAHTDPARFGKGLQTRGDIHPVAEDVVLLDDHISEVDADAEPDAAFVGYVGFTVSHPPLHLDCAPHGVQNAAKLCQQAVAGVLYDPAPMFSDLRIDQLPEMSLEAFVGPFFVRAH